MSTTAQVGVEITGRDSTGPAFASATARLIKIDRAAAATTNRMRNMSFQMGDVFTQLAGGANPLLIAAQQGPQIAQIYGFGNGGVAQAFKDAGNMMKGMVTRFPLITAAAVATGAGMLLLRNALSETTGEATTLGETFTATFEVIRDGLSGMVKGALDSMPGWVGDMANVTLGMMKEWGNNIIRVNVAWFKIVKAGIMALPDVFKVVGETSANNFIGAIEWMVNKAGSLINMFVDGTNAVFAKLPQSMQPGELGHMPIISLPKFDVGASAKSLSESFQAASKDLTEVWSKDYFGNIKDGIAQRILTNRKANEKDMPMRSKKIGRGRGVVDELAQEATALFKDMMTPLEAYQARITHLNTLLAKGYITQETYNRAVADAQNSFVSASAALNTFTDDVGGSFNAMQEFSGLFQSGIGNMFDSIIDGSKSAKKAGRDMVVSLLQDFTKLLAHQALLRMFQPAHALYGGGGGVFGGLFDFRPGFAVGADNIPNDMVARIHKGEMIIPRAGAEAIRRGETGGGGGNIIINNYAGAKVSAQRNDRGGADINIHKMIGESLVRQDSAMASFGIKRPVTNR